MQIQIPEKVIIKAIQQQYYNKSEASNFLGISIMTFKKWREIYHIPSVVVDGQVLFYKEDLEKFMEERRKK